MRRLNTLLLFIFLLTGCTAAKSIPTPGPVDATLPSPKPASATLPYTGCTWNWATQSLPELSAKVVAALQAAGFKETTVRAEAYGENCLTEAGKVDHFAAMETDFRLTVPVDSLNDTEKLGTLLEGILVVLDGFPAGSTPGPNPGFVGISFQKGSEQLNLWFPVTTGNSVRSRGYHGARLLEELLKK